MADLAESVRLSESAVTLLRFRALGAGFFPVRDCDRDAFQELVVAGIMAPDSEGDYRFTESGWARREEILREAAADRVSLLPHLPDRIDLSSAAKDVVRRHIAGDREVTGANREAYRELARAGILVSVGIFWER